MEKIRTGKLQAIEGLRQDLNTLGIFPDGLNYSNNILNKATNDFCDCSFQFAE